MEMRKVSNIYLILVSNIVTEYSEHLMREWIEQFIDAIDNIEIFYLTKFEEYSQEFDLLKEMYMRKKAS